MSEKFNPSNPEYMKVEDLPVEHQGEFVNVEGGFVRKETAGRMETAQDEAIIDDKIKNIVGGTQNLEQGSELNFLDSFTLESKVVNPKNIFKDRYPTNKEVGIITTELYSLVNNIKDEMVTVDSMSVSEFQIKRFGRSMKELIDEIGEKTFTMEQIAAILSTELELEVSQKPILNRSELGNLFLVKDENSHDKFAAIGILYLHRDHKWAVERYRMHHSFANGTHVFVCEN